MSARLCQECHHRPSGRTAEYGAQCQCKCHDVADAAPDLLAALELIQSNAGESAEWIRRLTSAAIAKARGES